MGMKFMQTAESNKKERLKNEAKQLVEEIEQSEEEGGLFNTSSKFAKMSSKFGGNQEKAPQIDTEEVLKAAQALYEKQ